MYTNAANAGFYEAALAGTEVVADGQQLYRQIGEAAACDVVFFGAGDNLRNMLPAVERLSNCHRVHLVEWDTVPEFEDAKLAIPRDQIFLVALEEERHRLHQLLDSGAVGIGYIGLPPNKHEEVAEEHLQRIGEGVMRHLILTKPIVEDMKALRRLRAAVGAAYARRRETRPELDDEIIYVHEHYIEKGAWRALRERLPEAVGKLGWLRKFTANIEEAQTIESENRGIDAFGDGAVADFGPHVISLALTAKEAINKSERYFIADRSSTETRAFRYADADPRLPEHAPTGFIVKGNATIVDKQSGSAHDMEFTWRAGKGLGTEDKKYVTLEFENPDTGVVSTIKVDLRNNVLEFSDEVPDEVRDLFSGFYSTENGYGPIVERGLNGNHPRYSFQPFDQGVAAAKWMFALEGQATKVASHSYDRTKQPSLEDMEAMAFGK